MEKQAAKSKSPFKGKKYKSLLTFFSPSVSKRSMKLKDSTKSLSSQTVNEENLNRQHPNAESLHYSSESIYSQIQSIGEPSFQELKSKQVDCSLANQSEKLTSSIESVYEEPRLTKNVNIIDVPVYSTVKKKMVPSSLKPQNFEIEDLKENNTTLKARIKDLSEDNRLLKKKLQDYIKEEKWKEGRLHSSLQLKITELENETRKEINSLSSHIQILIKEKEILNDQIDLLQSDKRVMQTKYEGIQEKLKNMVQPEAHKKVINDYLKLIADEEKRHCKEEDKLKELYEVLQKSNCSLEQRKKELEEKAALLETKIENFEKNNQELIQDKKNLLEQAEESKQMEQDMQTMLLSLLKVTESMAIERSILLKKTSFQDQQQKEIQSTVIDYSLNVGRLQEHILNLNKENHQELLALRTNKSQLDENLHCAYGRQFDILREKIITQNNRINELENENRKLESQLELIWQAACGKNSKLLEDVKQILQTYSSKEKT